MKWFRLYLVGNEDWGLSVSLSFSLSQNLFCLLIMFATLALFWLLYAWYIVFHPFTFKLFVSLNLKCNFIDRIWLQLSSLSSLTLSSLLFDRMHSSFTLYIVCGMVGIICPILLFVFYSSHVFSYVLIYCHLLC